MSPEPSAGRARKWMASGLLVVLLGVGATPTLAAAQSVGARGSAPAVVCGRSYGSQLARLEACMRNYHFPAAKRSKQPPRGATAACRDKSYSFSHSRWVACRGHRGVSRWLR